MVRFTTRNKITLAAWFLVAVPTIMFHNLTVSGYVLLAVSLAICPKLFWVAVDRMTLFSRRQRAVSANRNREMASK
jgi:hypothetical protein